MSRVVRYLTHPQVRIDPQIDIPRWPLNEVGRARVAALAASGALGGTTRIISSDETKAMETAEPLAKALGCDMQIDAAMHENDRSATGFLPPDEFEQVADAFFAAPEVSVRGWETAAQAQTRIVRAFETALSSHGAGDLLLVGHGGVGTLLYCHLADLPISREHDQGPGGGGCYFAFDAERRIPERGWLPMERLYGAG
ncbi:histidine phosphatase family protein [Roseobacter sinensis]|uniref:Phosphoglycerate mutase family protein n=1 Tax=Roseobacter sinensis TaxID=2931391 RepID=A0ABT3B8R8_9RHOB|nr:histidine phosphatase family protein [Roseobacter sp. WL0113]MCV3269960.1 phosphoglycerate mutase family protein [Roseobacter sp. WL0113]